MHKIILMLFLLALCTAQEQKLKTLEVPKKWHITLEKVAFKSDLSDFGKRVLNEIPEPQKSLPIFKYRTNLDTKVMEEDTLSITYLTPKGLRTRGYTLKKISLHNIVKLRNSKHNIYVYKYWVIPITKTTEGVDGAVIFAEHHPHFKTHIDITVVDDKKVTNVGVSLDNKHMLLDMRDWSKH